MASLGYGQPAGSERNDDANPEAETRDPKSIVQEARERLDQAYLFERENRREAAMDMAFVAGYQWPESIRKERQAAGRPILTINRLPQFIRQVTNDIRQADLAIKVSPVDDNADPKLTKIYNGLLRQIQCNLHEVVIGHCLIRVQFMHQRIVSGSSVSAHRLRPAQRHHLPIHRLL